MVGKCLAKALAKLGDWKLVSCIEEEGAVSFELQDVGEALSKALDKIGPTVKVGSRTGILWIESNRLERYSHFLFSGVR